MQAEKPVRERKSECFRRPTGSFPLETDELQIRMSTFLHHLLTIFKKKNHGHIEKMKFGSIETMTRIDFIFPRKGCCAWAQSANRMDPQKSAFLQRLPWNMEFFFLDSFPPQAEEFLRARFPLAARRRLLPGNRQNNDTGARRHPAFVVLASSPQ